MPGRVAASVRCCRSCRAIYRTDFERCPTHGTPLEVTDADPLIGTTVAHYVVDALIGEGAMGRVYRAHHSLLLHRQVALKVLLGDLAATLAMRLRFGQEADSASRLAHPNVVSVIDFGKTDEGLMFLAMELVEGPTLADLIVAEAPLPAQRVVRLARELCRGLAHAHARGLVHRDFKPDNVLVARGTEETECARIADFGIALSRDDDAPARLTTLGMALGTPMYAAPEQTHGLPVDHRADLFALGVTMYEMLAGKVPFDGTALELIHHNAEGKPPSIELRSGVQVPPVLELVVRRLMSRSPDERFCSAEAVLEALDEPSLLVLPAEVPAPAAARPIDTRRRWWLAGLAAVGLAGAVLAVVAVASLAPPPRSAAATTPPTALVAATPPAPTPAAPTPAAPTMVAPALVAPPTPAPTPPAPTTGVAIPTPPVVPLPAPAGRRPHAVSAPVHPPLQAAAIPDAPELIAPEAVVVTSPDAAPETVVVAAPPDAAPAPSIPVAPPRMPTRARASLGALSVHGSLSTSEISRALDRVLPDLRACFAQTAAATHHAVATKVHLAFVVDDTRRIASAHATAAAWPELGACVERAITALRTQVAPDVGAVDVTVDVIFQPEDP
ncbi:MAG TPA: serine/threonine-protein kinase [Kofleriaceae bacterium]